MIISVVTPHEQNSGNTTLALLMAHALADLKRNVFFSHVKPKSPSLYTYLGLSAFDDKTSTPTQLVKLMREGAIRVADIGDYCKNDVEYLDIFTNYSDNFTQDDMDTLLEFVTSSPDSEYEYQVFDIDADISHPSALHVLKKSDIIVLNLNSSVHSLEIFKETQPSLFKLFKDKKVIMVVNKYDSRVSKLKDVAKLIGAKTSPYQLRYNSWLQWACNRGKLSYLYLQGKAKDGDVIDIHKDVTTLALGVSKARVAILKQRQREGKIVSAKADNKPEPPKETDRKKTSLEKPKNVETE